MLLLLRNLPVILPIILLQNLYAMDSNYIEGIDSLSQNPQWLALGHYYSTGSLTWESEIDDASFFVSDKGKFSPKDELLESISNIKETNGFKFACRYPARYLYLKKHIKNLVDFDLGNCDKLQKWKKTYMGDSLTLIFPGSDITSPSSIFGHTFLRFDAKDRAIEFSPAVEFSAQVNTNDESIFSYIRKGLTGGFKGIYSVKPYYVKAWEYSDIQDRKIWEYKLNFTARQVDFLLLHLWELRGHFIDYYFANENCSYQI